MPTLKGKFLKGKEYDITFWLFVVSLTGIIGGFISDSFDAPLWSTYLMGIGALAWGVFWILMIVDVVKRKFPKGKEYDKTFWLVFIFLIGIIGAPIYYFMVKRKDKK